MMRQRQTQAQRLRQRLDPQLLLTNRLLQMPAVELQEYLSGELGDNPALEAADELPLPGSPDPRSAFRASLPAPARSRAAGDGGEEFDPLLLIASPRTLHDHLLAQLGTEARGADARVGRYLIGCIDAEGYLRAGVEEVAASLGTPVRQVLRVLAVIQTFDPAGVGARTLQECLLIQSRQLASDPAVPPLLGTILAECWQDLADGRPARIASRLRCGVEEVERTVIWLRRNLCPYPGSRYAPDWRRDDPDGARPVRPDVAVFLEEDGSLRCRIDTAGLPDTHVSPGYARLWERLRENPEQISETERRHIRDYLNRARRVLKGLHERKRILERLALCLLEEQEPFFRSERDEDMRPLTQCQLAAFLQVHESTVSRAAAGKFLQLPSGRVVPLRHFFDRSLSLRMLVAGVVAAEARGAPLSDQQISELLRGQGVTVARRTVMKYREELGILSSHRRARGAA